LNCVRWYVKCALSSLLATRGQIPSKRSFQHAISDSYLVHLSSLDFSYTNPHQNIFIHSSIKPYLSPLPFPYTVFYSLPPSHAIPIRHTAFSGRLPILIWIDSPRKTQSSSSSLHLKRSSPSLFISRYLRRLALFASFSPFFPLHLSSCLDFSVCLFLLALWLLGTAALLRPLSSRLVLGTSPIPPLLSSLNLPILRCFPITTLPQRIKGALPVRMTPPPPFHFIDSTRRRVSSRVFTSHQPSAFNTRNSSALINLAVATSLHLNTC